MGSIVWMVCDCRAQQGSVNGRGRHVGAGPAGRSDEQRRDNYHWVCPTCFEDFKDYFGWTIAS
jgi:hypothetical protein